MADINMVIRTILQRMEPCVNIIADCELRGLIGELAIGDEHGFITHRVDEGV